MQSKSALALQRLNAEIRADLEAQLNLLDKYETKGTFNYDILVAQAEAYAQIRQVNASVTDELTRQSKIREILNRLDRESRTIQKGYAEDAQDALQARSQLINDIANSTNKDFKGEAEKVKEVPEAIQRAFDNANQAGNELFRTFENLIFATKNWTDVLTDALKALSSVLIKFALGGLAGGDGQGLFSFLNGSLSPSTPQSNVNYGLTNPQNFSAAAFPAKASGGRVTDPARTWWVSRGPSCSSPARAARSFRLTCSTPPGQLWPAGPRAAIATPSIRTPWPGTNSSITKEKATTREMAIAGNSAVDVRYDSTVINNVSYVSEEQFQQGIKAAVAQSKASVLI